MTDEGSTTGPLPSGVAVGEGVSMGNTPGVPDGAMERGGEVEGWVEVDPVAAALGAWLDDDAAVSALDGVAAVSALDGELPGATLESGAFSPRK